LAELDLTPQEQGQRSRKARSLRNWSIVCVLLILAGFILFKALTSARVFYLNVDEAVAQKNDLGTDTFRMLGKVVSVPPEDEQKDLQFILDYGGKKAIVRHDGPEPTDLFECGVNVVVNGKWAGEFFESDQILIKHSEEYSAENPDRLKEGAIPANASCSDNSKSAAADIR
jgi:cytochrome c-type biogenesis protein CcmE